MTLAMHGPRPVRHAIRDFLFVEFPKTIIALRAELGLEDDQLPLPDGPDSYLPREVENLDRFPLLAVSVGRGATGHVELLDGGRSLYRTTYDVQVFDWIRGEGWNETQDMRDDHGTALRLTLLRNQTFGGREDMVLVESTMVQEFSEVQPVKGDRFVAGSFVGFSVQVDEVLIPINASQLSTVEEVAVTGQNVGVPLPFVSATLGLHPGLE
jgi:hypothetical protein